ncbi:MAG: hypothetical protein H7328_13185 [Bdellovibrio sp.]|nr:hypothetical protein [Bdellovibrio sp.]
MDFKCLIEQIHDEHELYEQLLAEVEDYFEKYLTTFVHFYFERLPQNKIKITDVCYFGNSESMFKVIKNILGKKEWYQIYHNHGHVDLWKCKLDTKAKVSVIYKERTHTENTGIRFLDTENHIPMTRDEIREAFQELCGVLQVDAEKKNLITKKAI